MTVREELERREHRILNPLAAFAMKLQAVPTGIGSGSRMFAPAISGIRIRSSTARHFAG